MDRRAFARLGVTLADPLPSRPKRASRPGRMLSVAILYQELGDPVKDREMLRAISPVFHADKIRRPLLVLQGQNDPRVIKPESDDVVAAVEAGGGAVGERVPAGARDGGAP